MLNHKAPPKPRIALFAQISSSMSLNAFVGEPDCVFEQRSVNVNTSKTQSSELAFCLLALRERVLFVQVFHIPTKPMTIVQTTVKEHAASTYVYGTRSWLEVLNKRIKQRVSLHKVSPCNCSTLPIERPLHLNKRFVQT